MLTVHPVTVCDRNDVPPQWPSPFVFGFGFKDVISLAFVTQLYSVSICVRINIHKVLQAN